MTPRPDRGRRGQVLIVAVLLIGVVFSAIVGTGLLVFHRGEIAPVQGQPTKDPNTGLYTAYVVVKGHRDFTFLHRNLHSNIHLDSVTYYFAIPPSQPSGRSWTDFSKSLHVTVTVTGSSIDSLMLNTFDVNVSVGAHWGETLTYALPSGRYTIEAQAVDQDGFRSSSTVQLDLP